MNTNNNRKRKIHILSAAGMIAISGVALFDVAKNRAENESISSLTENVPSDLSEETQEKIKTLDEKADVYRQIIQIKQQQQKSLENQISLIESQIKELEIEIEKNKTEIDQLNSQILDLQAKITEKQEFIEAQKKMLIELIQAYYDYNQRNVLSVFLENQDLATFMVTKDRLAQTGQKIKEVMMNVKAAKASLEDQTKALEEKKNRAMELRVELEDKNTKLTSGKSQKETLLQQTQGEESRYQELLARVEQQKLELLDIDQLSIASGLTADAYEKPPVGSLAPVSWFYSQKDPKWGNITIGNSNSSMKSWGCAVSAVAMVFSYFGTEITPGMLAKQPIFYWDLIAWPKSWPAANVAMTEEGNGHGNIDWKEIDGYLKNKIPVIIYIGKSNKKGGHYVVIHHKTPTGRYVVHDPYFGPNLYLDTSRALVGAMGQQSSTYMDQMIVYRPIKLTSENSKKD